MEIYSLLSGASDVAEAVQGKVKLGAAADDCRADLLEVAVPHELHPHDIRVGSPLRAGERKKGRKWRECCTRHSIDQHIEVCMVDAYRPVEAVAVVVQLSALLKKIKLDPVVETRHLSSLDLAYCSMCLLIITKKKHLLRLKENLLCPNLRRCAQSRWSPSCCCCGSTDQTTSSSGRE